MSTGIAHCTGWSLGTVVQWVVLDVTGGLGVRLVVWGGLEFKNTLSQILNRYLQAITAIIQGSSKQTMD